MDEEKSDLIEMAADIVSAYVGANSVALADLPALIHSVHNALVGVSEAPDSGEGAPKEPAVNIKRSITPDHLICLEDGRKFKSLKRHLRTKKYNMSPEDYRAKWGLAKRLSDGRPELREGPLQSGQADGPGTGRTAAEQRLSWRN